MAAILVVLLVCAIGIQMARVPKIYNALITSDANLSPSQAYPVLEPVLQTSAIGVAFPPLLVRPVYTRYVPRPDNQEIVASGGKQGQQPQSTGTKTAQLQYEGSLYPLAYDPYLQYGYRHDLLYPALPSLYQPPVFADVAHYAASNHNSNKNASKDEGAADGHTGQQEQVQPLPPPSPPASTLAPTPPAIHFQKEPVIPDVIPPLPVGADLARNP